MQPNRMMLPHRILPAAGKATTPVQGMVAFFCSTEIPLLYGSLQRFPISHQQAQKKKIIVLNNLLPEKHYFRLNRAEPPFAHVVLTEGQKRKPSVIREVAA